MKAKKRLTRKDPSYFIPLPYAMAIKRLISVEEMETHLFDGMQLSLRLEGLINVTISVVAHYNSVENVIGQIPNGMISRVQGLMEHDDRVSLSLERKFCDRLKNMFWISFDELPELNDLGLNTESN
jgi:hypothetical protein